MKNITIPENTRVIIDGDVIIFESKEAKQYEQHKWYMCDGFFGLITRMLSKNEYYCNGFRHEKGKWEWFSDLCVDLEGCTDADMKEVEKLLIAEAEKRGTKKGANFIDCDGIEKTTLSNPWLENNRLLVEIPSGIGILFDCKTGKWAEIVQEKKPPSFSDHMQKAYEKAQSDNLIKTIDDSFVFKIALDAAEEYISNNSTESQSR